MFLKCYFPTLKCYKGAHMTFLPKCQKCDMYVHFNVGLLPQILPSTSTFYAPPHRPVDQVQAQSDRRGESSPF